MIPHNVVICGICKDIQDRLPYSIKIAETIGSMFESYRVCMYEDNSKDSTKSILLDWHDRDHRIIVKCEDTHELKYVNSDYLKSSGTSRARNIVMRMLPSYVPREYDYIIWMDMDFKVEPNYAGFEEVFKNKDNWDAVFAYGLDPTYGYWDWLAFRDKKEPLGPELIGHSEWYSPKQNLILDKEWYPVYSAFGGCGIYKRSAVSNFQYSAEVTLDMEKVYRKLISDLLNEGHPRAMQYIGSLAQLNKIKLEPPYDNRYTNYEKEGFYLFGPLDGIADPLVWRMNSFTYQYPVTCDHVPFHMSMIANGFDRLYICPSLVFNYGEPK